MKDGSIVKRYQDRSREDIPFKYRSGYHGYQFSFSEDRRVLARSRANSTIILYHTDDDGLKIIRGQPVSMSISSAGDLIAIADMAGDVRIVNTSTGENVLELKGNFGLNTRIAFAGDGSYLVTAADDKSMRLWNPETGLELMELTQKSDIIESIAYTPDGRILSGVCGKKGILLWDTDSGEETGILPTGNGEMVSMAINPDGNYMAGVESTQDIYTLRIWKLSSGVLEHESSTPGRHVRYTEDGNSLLSYGPGLVILDPRNGELRADIMRFAEAETRRAVYSLAVAPDRAAFACGWSDGTITLWPDSLTSEPKLLHGHQGWINHIDYSPDGRFLASAGKDGYIRIWDANDGTEKIALAILDKTAWAAITPGGLFDASEKGMRNLHYVIGLETVALEQLKERYYLPGLVPKVLGFDTEGMRNAESIGRVELYPEVSLGFHKPSSDSLQIVLENRGGGIGKIQVFVNGKEVLDDARPNGAADRNRGTIHVDLDCKELRHVIPGENNVIEVFSWNGEEYLSSRRHAVKWRAPGTRRSLLPKFWGIVGGVSRYKNEALTLNYASKDASDISKSLEVAARRLFGDGNVEVVTLVSEGSPEPTKDNFKLAFEKVQHAKPADVVVVYLAGHGVSLQGMTDSYCFLTSEAWTRKSEALLDPAIRRETAIMTGELTEWLNRIPALKIVLIIDACGAGAVSQKLASLRYVSSDQIRAIERLRDRTGIHVLMGCAANRVSYEASKYGQGLLTYALLEGMKGAALREEKYVDVLPLFEYAARRVPALAHDVGGTQKPEIKTPGGSSFDIGLLLDEDRNRIPLSDVKPLLLKPRVLNSDKGFDDLNLETQLRRELRNLSYSHMHDPALPEFVFVEAESMPGAILPSGTYTVSGNDVIVRLRLVRDGNVIESIDISGMIANINDLVDNLASELTQAIQK